MKETRFIHKLALKLLSYFYRYRVEVEKLKEKWKEDNQYKTQFLDAA